MATEIVLVSCNMMHHIGYCKNLPIIHKMINKSTNSIGFKDHPPIRGIVSFRQARRRFSLYSVQPGNLSPPPPPTDDSWQEWIFGIITTIIVPFFTTKWRTLLEIEDGVDTMIEETDKIVECVEEVAETIDKVAKDVADTLQEHGKWKEAAVFVESVAEEISKEAHFVEDFLHEVEQVEEKVDLLVDSVMDESKNLREK